MKNKFFVIKQIDCDPSHLDNEQRLQIVTFHIDVLDKYRNDPENYDITLHDNVGTLSPSSQEFVLPIDMHDRYVSAWLYQIGYLPREEQKHFASYNIYPRELSETAYRRWVNGQP